MENAALDPARRRDERGAHRATKTITCTELVRARGFRSFSSEVARTRRAHHTICRPFVTLNVSGGQKIAAEFR